MKRKVVLSAGGTGGHLFPAQTLARSLPEWEVVFVAGGLKTNRYFDQKHFSFEEVESATFKFSRPFQVIQGCGKIYKGVRQSQKLLRSFSPDLVVGFGSFFTLPVLAAALLEKVPFILHEQNTVPGKVNRLFAPFSRMNTITFPKTREYFSTKALKKTREVVYPLREPSKLTQKQCLDYFGLLPETPTLLVFGGSQGAERLNLLFLEAITHLSAYQVLHFTGSDARTFLAEKHYQQFGIRACVKSFEPFMDRAMRVAEFAITRAGASTISELIEYELPAILIPYPYATDNHQEKNAEHFVSLVKAGTMYKEKELDGLCLSKIMMQLHAQLQEKKRNLFLYKKERCAQQLADLIEEIFYENN